MNQAAAAAAVLDSLEVQESAMAAAAAAVSEVREPMAQIQEETAAPTLLITLEGQAALLVRQGVTQLLAEQAAAAAEAMHRVMVSVTAAMASWEAEAEEAGVKLLPTAPRQQE
jgi:hypothetical protein